MEKSLKGKLIENVVKEYLYSILFDEFDKEKICKELQEMLDEFLNFKTKILEISFNNKGIMVGQIEYDGIKFEFKLSHKRLK